MGKYARTHAVAGPIYKVFFDLGPIRWEMGDGRREEQATTSMLCFWHGPSGLLSIPLVSVLPDFPLPPAPVC